LQKECEFVKKLSESLFKLICIIFSAVMIVLSLLSSIKLASLNDAATKTEKTVKELKTENDILRAEYENSMSLEELERYATEVLGMRPCSAEQIVYIELK